MDVQDSPETTLTHGPTASVLSLSLHRLKLAPRAVHRAFLSRASMFRPSRNIKGLFSFEALAFLGDANQNESFGLQMISQAERLILIVGERPNPEWQAVLDDIRREKPQVKIREMSTALDQRILVVDEQMLLLGHGDLGVGLKGDAARAVSDLFQICLHSPAASTRRSLRWPAGTRIDLEGLQTGLSRTWVNPDQPTIIEIERLTISAIRSARRFIFIESMAFTSPVVASALAHRLKAESAPEVLMLLPAEKSLKTRREKMRAALQAATLAQILKADRFGKFRAFEKADGTDGCGVMIVDDQFLKIGSSQMTSRSLGAERAVDLSIEAVGRPHVVTAIARLRRERIGAILDLEPSEFDARFLLNGSLIHTFESFFTLQRNLRELTPEASTLKQILYYFAPLIDPKRPRRFGRWVTKKLKFAPKIWRYAFILVIIFALLITIASLFAPFTR